MRSNQDGHGILPFYGRLSSVATDPIEKKPLYHFCPGATILSVGFWGCNFHCPFCQNYQISQTTGSSGPLTSPRQLVDRALRQGSIGIAYTYSEPLVHFEYVRDTAELASRAGLKNVLVTAGYVNPEPASRLLSLMDATNVDFKGWGAAFYSEEIGGHLEQIKRFLSQAASAVHLEVTTLVIPGKNDSDAEIDAMARFLAGLDPGIPYHLSAYYPAYRYRIPATPEETLHRLAEVARRHLRYVYLGNVSSGESNTHCACGSLLVRRAGYHVSVVGVLGGKCRSCSRPAPIVVD